MATESDPLTLVRLDGATEAFRGLLSVEDLATDDLNEPERLFFEARCEGVLIGYIGYERLGGGDGLLRSCVVLPARRALGHGTAMVAALEREAARAGLSRLFLVTDTAEEFFRTKGYEPVARDDLPAHVAATCQVSILCTPSATVMRREL